MAKYNRQDYCGRYFKPSEVTCFFGAGRPNGFMSQWYFADFVSNGITFKTAEHYMMYNKAIIFGCNDLAQVILKTHHPKDVKRLGRSVKPFDPVIWSKSARDIVLKGNVAKFSCNPILQEMLLDTGDTILIEASPYDDIWGAKLSADNPNILIPENWPGTNFLGFALMEVRDILRERK